MSFGSFGPALVLVALALGGCSSGAEESDALSAEDALEQRSYRITVEPDAKDVARECVALFARSLDAAKSARRDIKTITRENVGGFGSRDRALAEILERLLETRAGGIPVDEVEEALTRYVTDAIVQAAGPDGKISDSAEERPTGIGHFDEALKKVARPLLRAMLKESPLGSTEMLDEWEYLEPSVHGELAAYRVGGELGRLRIARLLALPPEPRVMDGEAAVGTFLEVLENEGGYTLDMLAILWRSSSVKRCHMYQYSTDGPEGWEDWTVLAVIDQDGFLYAFIVDHQV